MSRPAPVLTAPLFRPLEADLVALLRGLDPEDWDAPTSAGRWTVRDVAAHLLELALRRVSVDRDGHFPPPPASPIRGYDDLVAFLDRMNREWVEVARRFSPGVLTDLLAWAGPALADAMEAADPDADATYPVAWAGEERSAMWFDVGREYVERWHHQDQIRDAVGAPPIRDPDRLRPVLELSVAALPRAFAGTDAEPGTRVALVATGPAGGAWVVERGEGWTVAPMDGAEGGAGAGGGDPTGAACRIEIGDLELARLLTHRLSAAAAREAASVTGDPALAEPLLSARAVMV